MYYPEGQILLLLLPIPLPARQFVVLYGALELVLGVTGTQAGVAHFAHLGGLAGGYLLMKYWRK
jgi:membrane associated rhomboid family serine protease